MLGVDATTAVVELGRQRCRQEGFADQIEFVVGDAGHTGLADNIADFVWGEDAWCYVVDKARLIAEATRLVKPGGVLAFTDWIEGPAGMSETESQRLLRFMKFPDLQDLAGYTRLLSENECEVTVCEDTGLFASHIDLYLSMLRMQLTSEALRIIGFDVDMFQALIDEMTFMRQLAREGKIAQGRVVARKIALRS
jgi:SAM-dependent methyltransferase